VISAQAVFAELPDWSLTSLQTRAIKIGARVVRHSRANTIPTGRGGRQRRSVHQHSRSHTSLMELRGGREANGKPVRVG